jgi:CrcB protein
MVCLGGAVGSGLRYVVSGLVLRAAGPGFPAGTLAVNAGGSFLLSFVMFAGVVGGSMSPGLRLLLTTGLLGGFTTYSTFNYETLELLQQGSLALAGLNILVTLVSCLAAGLLGIGAARWVYGL